MIKTNALYYLVVTALISGFVTTVARAVADLILSGEDISLVAAVLRDAFDAGFV